MKNRQSSRAPLLFNNMRRLKKRSLTQNKQAIAFRRARSGARAKK